MNKYTQRLRQKKLLYSVQKNSKKMPLADLLIEFVMRFKKIWTVQRLHHELRPKKAKKSLEEFFLQLHIVYLKSATVREWIL